MANELPINAGGLRFVWETNAPANELARNFGGVVRTFQGKVSAYPGAIVGRPTGRDEAAMRTLDPGQYIESGSDIAKMLTAEENEQNGMVGIYIPQGR